MPPDASEHRRATWWSTRPRLSAKRAAVFGLLALTGASGCVLALAVTALASPLLALLAAAGAIGGWALAARTAVTIGSSPPDPDGDPAIAAVGERRTEAGQHVLAEAGAVLAASSDYTGALIEFAWLTVPSIADWCSVYLMEADGTPERLIDAFADARRQQLADDRDLESTPPLEDSHPVMRALHSGETQVGYATAPELFDPLQPASGPCIAVPMLSQGRTLGVIAFGMAESGRDYSPQDVALTEELARRAAVAVDNALLYTAEQHARRAAERAVERTARLQEITAALAESYTEEQVAGVIVEQGRLALGATGCAIFRTDPLRGLLHLTAASGLSEEALTQWETIHWSTPTPAGEAAATGQLVLAGSPDVLEERFPGMFLEPGWQALAAIPLQGNGETVMVLSFEFNAPQRFSLHEITYLLALSRQCTQAFERARSFAAEQQARAMAQEAREQVRNQLDFTLAITGSLGEGVCAMDAQGRVTFMNYAAEEMLGWSHAELVEQPLHDIVHFQRADGSHLPAEECPMLSVMRSGVPARVDGDLLVRRDGSHLPVAYTSSPIAQNGRITGAVVAFHDITERMHAEAALRRSEERFRSLVQHSSDMILVLDAAGTVEYVSASIEQLLGHTPDELIGDNATTLVHEEDRSRVAVYFRSLLDGEPEAPSIEFRIRHRENTWHDFEAVCTNLLHDPSVRGVVINARDVTERKQYEQNLAYQAFHDPLTGLPNRALFMDRLEHTLARNSRTQSEVAVLFLDLDRFKVINDSLGHATGDDLLVTAGRRLALCLRPGDTIARFGGDEFVILLSEIESEEEAVGVAERLIAGLRRPFVVRDHEFFLSASIGVVYRSSVDAEPGELLRDADVALYRAKAGGRARYALYHPGMNDRAVELLDLEAELRRAIGQDELCLYYQPQVDLRTGEVVGMEALVRWQHPQRGLVPPIEFIPLAEETGLIRPMGKWILREACRQARAWHELTPDAPPLLMSVNLAAPEFQQPDFVAGVARTLEETGLDPHYLCLEITESTIMEHGGQTIALLWELKRLGVRLIIDDFGTGYSSLSYLKRFPVDAIKVDKSFVEEIGEAVEDVAIVRAVVTLAQTLNLEVTAEGVETAEQLAYLRDLGCDLAQGYYLSRPLPAEAATDLLTGHTKTMIPALLPRTA